MIALLFLIISWFNLPNIISLLTCFADIHLSLLFFFTFTEIEEWHKREVIRDILELQKYPSIIKYIAGRRDDNKEVVKVYLSEDNEDAKNVFVRCCKVSKDTIFEFVNVEKWKQSQKNDEIKGTERKPRSVDNSERKELLQIIRKYRKKIYARHSNVIGIRIGNVIQKRDLIQEKTCIILYCLDKTLIPFGEKPLPDSIEGWPCDVREDFFMLGTCPKNCPSTNKDFPELGCSIGMHSKNGSGSVGFLYESIKYGSGFLTASHVAIANCHELHVDNSLLSNHPLGKETHLIVHPSWSDNKKSNRTVGKVVESFYGEYKLSEELYEGLDFAAVKTDHCRVGGKCRYTCVSQNLSVTKLSISFKCFIANKDQWSTINLISCNRFEKRCYPLLYVLGPLHTKNYK